MELAAFYHGHRLIYYIASRQRPDNGMKHNIHIIRVLTVATVYGERTRQACRSACSCMHCALSIANSINTFLAYACVQPRPRPLRRPPTSVCRKVCSTACMHVLQQLRWSYSKTSRTSSEVLSCGTPFTYVWIVQMCINIHMHAFICMHVVLAHEVFASDA